MVCNSCKVRPQDDCKKRNLVQPDCFLRQQRFTASVLDVYDRLAKGSKARAHMSQQLFESVSSIGANLEEGVVANSRRDMALKYAVALRESREARYWLKLLARDPAWTNELKPLEQEATEFVAILTSSVRKLRQHVGG